MILDSFEFSSQLFDSVGRTESSFYALSAFVKTRALEDPRFEEPLRGKEVAIVARWRKGDLLAGASDLSLYHLCRKRGWRFGINTNLHGKVFVVDRREIFLGSANLTQKGLQIGCPGNSEFGIKFKAEEADVNKVEKFIDDEVVWLNDELYSLLEEHLQGLPVNDDQVRTGSWPKYINDRVLKPVKYLWVQEALFTSPRALLHLNLDDEKHLHDFNLLGLDLDDVSPETLTNSFRRLRLYKWLVDLLIAEDSLSFGGFSSNLHSALMDDPKPYRRDVKDLVETIFDWLMFLEDEFVITKHRRTSSVKLRKSE